MTNVRPIERTLLRSFSPLDSFKSDSLHAVEQNGSLVTFERGHELFAQGQSNTQTFYLVSGVVELLHDGKVIGTVRGSTSEARFPLGTGALQRHGARILSSRAECLVIDSELLDKLLTWDQTGAYYVGDLQGTADHDADDWMVRLLQSHAFQEIPPANIQSMFMRLVRVDYRAGETVVRQGTDGDYFYIIVRGRCVVRRHMPLKGEALELAELGVGDTFGEEALIIGGRRNASVQMLTDGTLMRLSKTDFRMLCEQPLLKWVNLDQARQIVRDGGQWLDVRLPSEVENYGIPGAMNVPLYYLRGRLETLSRTTQYVVCCDTGRRSSVAAYLLAQEGFTVYGLRNGLAAWPELSPRSAGTLRAVANQLLD